MTSILDAYVCLFLLFYASLNKSDSLSLLRLQIVVVNRLILNLSHTANTREGDSESGTRTSYNSSPLFATNSVLGNIGAPVRTYRDEVEYEYAAWGVEGRDASEGVVGRSKTGVDAYESLDDSRHGSSEEMRSLACEASRRAGKVEISEKSGNGDKSDI